jgi:hypothetical protein
MPTATVIAATITGTGIGPTIPCPRKTMTSGKRLAVSRYMYWLRMPR